MRDDWISLEADFQREYNINLIECFRTMSLRRFVALFYCLSNDSLLVSKERYEQERDGQEKDMSEYEEASFDDINW